MDGAGGTRRTSGAESTTSRTACGFAIGTTSSSHDGAAHCQRLSRPVELAFALWTREAVQELLSRKFDLQVSVWTVGRYLRAWGLTPQKPVRRAYEQNPAAVRKWLEEEYPSIRELARQFKAQIHWLDEMGLRS